jgi:hypothetical protein
MKTNSIINSALVLLLMASFSSCKKDEETTTIQQTVKFKAVYTPTKATSSNVALSSFLINIEEIELDYDDDYDEGNDSVATDLELKGPFEINLLKDGIALQKTISKSLNLPNGTYDEIEFEIDYSENPNSVIYQKSIEIKGSIDGKQFIFWTNEEFEIEKEFENKLVINNNNNQTITVAFDLTNLFNKNNGGVDLSEAKDGNNNGIIEIYPGNNDGNNELYDTIEDSIWDFIDAYED